MNEILRNVGLVLGSYLIGSIPFGVLVARAKGVDILTVGSGNMGATNVGRALGCKYGVIVFLLDTIKGAIPAIVGTTVLQSQSLGFCLGLLAIIGHSLSPFVKFKGGKGVAAGLGAITGSLPILGITGFSTFLVMLALTRYVSLSSIIAVWTIAGTSFFVTKEPMFHILFVALAIFVTLRHKENLARLRAGTERRFSFKSSESVAASSTETDSPDSPIKGGN